MIWLYLLPVLVALICIVLAFLPVKREKVSHPGYTDGVIIGHRTQMVTSHRTETKAFAPVVQYTVQGREITAAARNYVPEWKYTYRVGDKVRICYHTKQPDLFQLCPKNSTWRKGILLTVGIGTLLAYGVLMVQYL